MVGYLPTLGFHQSYTWMQYFGQTFELCRYLSSLVCILDGRADGGGCSPSLLKRNALFCPNNLPYFYSDEKFMVRNRMIYTFVNQNISYLFNCTITKRLPTSSSYDRLRHFKQQICSWFHAVETNEYLS